jgi:uncharacterized integral membrane protein
MVFRKIRSLIRWCFAVSLCTAFTVFAVNNRDTMMIDLFPFPFIVELPKFLYSIFFLVCGLLIGWYSCGSRIWKLSLLHRQDEQKIAALENEVAGYVSEQSSAPAAPSGLISKS